MTVLAANPNGAIRTLDPRAPRIRVAALLDAGTVVPLRHADSSGVYAVRGQIDGVKPIVYCTDLGYSRRVFNHELLECRNAERCPWPGTMRIVEIGMNPRKGHPSGEDYKHPATGR